MTALQLSTQLDAAIRTLAALGGPLEWALLATSAVVFLLCATPFRRGWRRPALGVLAALLAAGELLLAWFHWRLWELSPVVNPVDGTLTVPAPVPAARAARATRRSRIDRRSPRRRSSPPLLCLRHGPLGPRAARAPTGTIPGVAHGGESSGGARDARAGARPWCRLAATGMMQRVGRGQGSGLCVHSRSIQNQKERGEPGRRPFPRDVLCPALGAFAQVAEDL
jgi:hypothetical protein